MLGIVVFDICVFILLLIGIYFLGKTSFKNLYDRAVIFTILVYRVTTWIALAFGLHFEQLGTSQLRYDHKWLGVTIIFLVLLFWPKHKAKKYRLILLGIGTGQIIDEVSEFLMLLGLPIPLAFRDTLPDLGLILLTLSLFLIVKNIFLKSSK